ncbi:hypothetical protein Patl1_08506 [Pistacia atlantica]|uniref:Uncharacterized protein n=1 Tax=Pistacia atlantica TaxID=434234 RepID=A0ACC1AIW5_9ROSI|nr:hypothetical protein Patl1_08506 [Pistacia atlantica]
MLITLAFLLLLFLFFFLMPRKWKKSKVPLADYLINGHHFSPEAALKASLTTKYLKKPENSELSTLISQRKCVDKLVPSILVLKSVSGSNASVAKLLKTSGWFWLHKPDSFKEFVKKVDEIGFDRKSKMFLPVILTIGSMSMETLELLKLKCFRSLGFKEDGIVSTFRRSPQTFVISKRKIREVTEVMLSRGNLDISVIVNNPWLLICNVEQRLKAWAKGF